MNSYDETIAQAFDELISHIIWHVKRNHSYDDSVFEKFIKYKNAAYTNLVTFQKEINFSSLPKLIENIFELKLQELEISKNDKLFLTYQNKINWLSSSKIITKLAKIFEVNDVQQKDKIQQANPSINLTNMVNQLNGDEEDIEDWFKEFERLTRASNWSESDMGDKISIWFKNKALRIWEDLDDQNKYNYKAIKEH